MIRTMDMEKLILEARANTLRFFSSDIDIFDTKALSETDEKLTPAAVLLPIIERKNGLNIVLTKRSEKLKHHPGQVAFPGGKLKVNEETAWDCALRESQEEIGLDPSGVRKIGRILTHQTITGYEVTPFVAEVLAKDFSFLPDDKEVEEIFEVPLEFILSKENMTLHVREISGQKRGYYAIPFGPYYIWGATARIIKSFSDLVSK